MNFLTPDILRHQLLEEEPSEVILCLPKNSTDILADSISEYEKICPNIIIHEGLVDERDFSSSVNGLHKLIIFDDNFFDMISSDKILKLMVFSGKELSL